MGGVPRRGEGFLVQWAYFRSPSPPLFRNPSRWCWPLGRVQNPRNGCSDFPQPCHGQLPSSVSFCLLRGSNGSSTNGCWGCECRPNRAVRSPETSREGAVGRIHDCHFRPGVCVRTRCFGPALVMGFRSRDGIYEVRCWHLVHLVFESPAGHTWGGGFMGPMD